MQTHVSDIIRSAMAHYRHLCAYYIDIDSSVTDLYTDRRIHEDGYVCKLNGVYLKACDGVTVWTSFADMYVNARCMLLFCSRQPLEVCWWSVGWLRTNPPVKSSSAGVESLAGISRLASRMAQDKSCSQESMRGAHYRTHYMR